MVKQLITNTDFQTLKKIFLALCIYFFICYWNEFSNINFVNNSHNQPPLYDRVHHALPLISSSYCDWGLALFLIYFILRWGLQDLNILSNYLWIVAILFFGRFLCFTLTQYPPAVSNCADTKHTDPWRWTFFYDTSYCNDYLFSGHTLHTVLILLFVLNLQAPIEEKIIIFVLTIVEILLILASRIHYTSDVIVAIILTILIFYAWPGVGKITDNIKSFKVKDVRNTLATLSKNATSHLTLNEIKSFSE